MDGSVSTLAPIFATVFATHRPFTAFLVGIASATGAGISMAFSEALSDDGELTGRGNPVMRGSITGGMTFLGGALHTLPFLVPELHLALLVAYVVVAVELVLIAGIRHRFFGTSWWGGAGLCCRAHLRQRVTMNSHRNAKPFTAPRRANQGRGLSPPPGRGYALRVSRRYCSHGV
jgi:hypothetical protein